MDGTPSSLLVHNGMSDRFGAPGSAEFDDPFRALDDLLDRLHGDPFPAPGRISFFRVDGWCFLEGEGSPRV